jgi:hypothetical protein
MWLAVVASQEEEVGDCHDAIVMQRVACSKPGSMACKGATADLAKAGCDDASGPGDFLDHMDDDLDLGGHSAVKQLGERDESAWGRRRKKKRFGRTRRRSSKKLKRGFRSRPRYKRKSSKKRFFRRRYKRKSYKRKSSKRYSRKKPKRKSSKGYSRKKSSRSKRPKRIPKRPRKFKRPKRPRKFKRPKRVRKKRLRPRRAAGGSRKEKEFFKMLRGLLYSDPRKCGSPGQCAKVVQTALRADKKLQKATLKVKAAKSAKVKECAKVVAKAIKTTKTVMLEQQKKQKLGTPDQCAKVVAAALKIAEKIRPGTLRTKRLKALARGSASKYFWKP